MLEVLKKSKKWVPRFEEETKLKNEKDKIREEALQLGIERGRKEGKEEGKKEKAIEMAKKLKKKGIDVDIISETSGLSKEEIEKI
jgi:predicted transposase/invertase (TIGR01784 family)